MLKENIESERVHKEIAVKYIHTHKLAQICMSSDSTLKVF